MQTRDHKQDVFPYANAHSVWEAGGAGTGQQGKWGGAHIKLEIVTLSTAELSSENNPLR